MQEIHNLGPPKILGRYIADPDGTPDPRAATSPGPEASVPFSSGAAGTARVQLFLSEDDEDRGGVVMRLSIEDDASCFAPLAISRSPGCVEVHLAGDAEAASLVRALRGALAALP
jgi:hypothetical protein